MTSIYYFHDFLQVGDEITLVGDRTSRVVFEDLKILNAKAIVEGIDYGMGIVSVRVPERDDLAIFTLTPQEYEPVVYREKSRYEEEATDGTEES